MINEGFKGLPETDRHQIIINIGRKRAEWSKSFIDTLNKELEEMEQLIMYAIVPNGTVIASDHYGQDIHKKRYSLGLVLWKNND